MLVNEMMSTPVFTCSPTDALDRAAALMWEHDCGCVPVVENGKVVAMVTDRDVCMAAFTRGVPLAQIPVSTAASQTLFSVCETDGVDRAEELMSTYQIRRVPVVDAKGAPVGILALNDLVRNAGQLGRRRHVLSAESLVRTIAAVCKVRGDKAKSPDDGSDYRTTPAP
jgi:CBS domain-containing protein